jgi:hypothetical protein
MSLQEITHKDLRFEQVPITMHSSRGTQYLRWVDIGMPKIPETILKHVFYLYKSYEDAEKGSEYGGTGFLVAIPSEKYYRDYKIAHIYGVTNWHNALEGGFSVIRINTIDGKTDILDFNPTEWEWIPGGDDIAAIEIPISKLHDVQYISTTAFATDQIITENEIGIGDDVFMVGRFVNYDGGPINAPAVRFGNISVMPSPILQPTGYAGDSYCIDLHSRTGFSGSPVFVFRTPASNIDAIFKTGKVNLSESFLYLLGIHWGQFPEDWELKEIKLEGKPPRSNLILEGAYVEGFSGMTCVIPAKKILDLLNVSKFINRREKEEKEIGERFRKNGFPPKPESSSEKPIPKLDNPQHKEDFNSLVGAAAKKKKQDD